MSESSDERAWKRESLPVPHAMTRPDRVSAARYYDPDFYALEVERPWPRVRQMACRLEEIPEPGDFVEYEKQHQAEFEYMRLSREVEGSIGNYQCLIDGYLAGLDYEQLLPAARKVCVGINERVPGLGF